MYDDHDSVEISPYRRNDECFVVEMTKTRGEMIVIGVEMNGIDVFFIEQTKELPQFDLLPQVGPGGINRVYLDNLFFSSPFFYFFFSVDSLHYKRIIFVINAILQIVSIRKTIFMNMLFMLLDP